MMMRFLYNLLFPFAFVALLPKYLFRMWRRGGYARDILQRIGLYRGTTRAKLYEGGRAWIHAVSVGEATIAMQCLSELRKRDAGIRFVVSTTTSTAYAVIQKALDPSDVLIYFPLDFPLIMRRVVKRLCPRMLILTECELWPNLVESVAETGAPVFLMNARISERSYRGYRILKGLFAQVLGRVTLITTQTDADRIRLVGMGADPARIHVLGSAKYDAAPSPDSVQGHVAEYLGSLGIPSTSPLLVGGSTWPGEEAALLGMYARLRDSCLGLKLVLVPRHAERAAAIAQEIESHGFRYARRSKGVPGQGGGIPDVVLVDTTGELIGFYSRATVVFVGKSLTAHGAQNMIEPAALGKAVVIGPNTENFQGVMTDFLSVGGILQIRNVHELEESILRLLKDPTLREMCGSRARTVVESHRGVMSKTSDLILRHLDAPPVADGQQQ